MPLHVYNTLTRSKELFTPLVQGRVGMYVCGPTVYGHAHLGHAKSYVSFDVIVRYLRYSGYAVLYVQNITDVGHLTDDADEGEDKLERQSVAALGQEFPLDKNMARQSDGYLQEIKEMLVQLLGESCPVNIGH